MNVVREINRINEAELKLGTSGSWHDEYKDSAYIFVGGLHLDLTEGDVITIFSQYGEIMDINLPRDKETGKPKGFGFLMYEDQRSTILAVDNLNGAQVLNRTLRVDHVKNYKQPKTKGDDGEWVEPEEQSLNAKPEMIIDDAASDSDSSSGAGSIDPEDPMREYLISKRKEAKKASNKKSKRSKKNPDETPEEQRARKARKREKKARKAAKKSEGVRGVEMLLESLGQDVARSAPGARERQRSASLAGRRRRSPSPYRERSRERNRSPPPDRRPRSRSPPPGRRSPGRDGYQTRTGPSSSSRHDEHGGGNRDGRRRSSPRTREYEYGQR